jgi:hypothetical protein
MNYAEWPVRVPRRTGLGGITDAPLQAAAQALLTDLQSSGCTQGVDDVVAAFQNAWNAANAGSPLVLSDGSTGADGLYGANTQSALQATLNASGQSPVPQAPTGCVAADAGSANATQGGGAATAPTTHTTTATTTPSGSNWILWGVGAAAVAGLTAAYAVSRKKKRG